MTTNWPELDKDHLIKICIDQNIELDALREKLAAMESQKADKPAVAVPYRELLRSIVDKAWNEATESQNVPITKWADQIIDSVIAAATSRSQQSEPDWENEAKRAFWCGLEIGAGMGSVPILPRWDEYIAKRKGELFDRCPIHESEQLQTLRAHGLAENQQTEGE